MSDKEFFKSLKDSNMNEIKKQELLNYFSPIYYCEFEYQVTGELFPRTFRWGHYGRSAKKEAEQQFNEHDDAVRIIEKSMVTGAERVYKTREK